MTEPIRASQLIDELPASYLHDGAGLNVLLFLHGWGGSAESFLPLWRELRSLEAFSADNWRFVAPDFPGFGESAEPREAWDVSRYTQWVLSFVKSLDVVEAVHVVSHSFGGRVTTVLLDEHPAVVTQAFYIAPAGIRHNNEGVASAAGVLKRVFQLPGLRALFPFVRTVGYKLTGGQDYLKVTGVMKETFKLVTQEDLSPRLSHISSPVHVAFGRHDSYVPYTDGEHMQKAIPGAQLTVFDDGKHGIHKTHATQLAPLIRDFLA
jgi:pimeloyl-ACP methyl ester carboxylesterase